MRPLRCSGRAEMTKVETQADKDVEACLDGEISFALIAGSGKTSSLIDALEWVREHKGKALRQTGQCVACITILSVQWR